MCGVCVRYVCGSRCVYDMHVWCVCERFKAPPCVHPQRLRVCLQNAPHAQSMWGVCRHIRRRVECTHGGVLNLHTVFFCVPHQSHNNTQQHTTPTQHTTPPQTHTTTQQQHNNNTTHNTTHNTTQHTHTHEQLTHKQHT